MSVITSNIIENNKIVLLDKLVMHEGVENFKTSIELWMERVIS